MQLWRPCRVEGEIVMADPDAQQPFDDSLPRRASRGSVQTSSGSSYSSNNSQQEHSSGRNVKYGHHAQRFQEPSAFAVPVVVEPLFDHWSARNELPRQGSTFRPRPSQDGPAMVDHRLPAIAPDFTAPSRRMSALRGQQQDIGDRPRPLAMEDYGPQRGGTQRGRTRTGTETLQSFANKSVFSARDVPIAGSMNLKSTGTLHCMPTDPLMVLFTKGAGGLSIVALSVDSKVVANYSVCRCLTGIGPDGNGCRISALERSGSNRSLNLLRLGEGGGFDFARVGESQLNILPLAETRRGERSARQRKSDKKWRTIIRISILHQSMLDRFHFSGMPCGCAPSRACREGELMQCLAAGHRGLLGLLKEWYRREVVEWTANRYQLTGNVIQT